MENKIKFLSDVDLDITLNKNYKIKEAGCNCYYFTDCNEKIKGHFRIINKSSNIIFMFVILLLFIMIILMLFGYEKEAIYCNGFMIGMIISKLIIEF